MGKFTIALEGIEWVHGTVGMFMFILQEAALSQSQIVVASPPILEGSL